MASTFVRSAIVGSHIVHTVQTGTVQHMPRFRNTSPDGRTLVQYQADCQTAALALCDARVAIGPNATAALHDLR